MAVQSIANPFRPGAGHMPPYLAGRKQEQDEFKQLLNQDVVLKNLVLTGLRGIGKTVLLETFKPLAIQMGWLWAGTDLSESTSISESNLAVRLLTDLSVVTSSIVISLSEKTKAGFGGQTTNVPTALNYQTLAAIYDHTPGLVSDKLKGVLEFVWPYIRMGGKQGIIFAYDEAQNLADHSAKDQFPLSLLLDVFQSVQRKDICYMLALTGLPTLFPKLVEARTYSERMFHVIFLEPLTEGETREAVRRPIEESQELCPLTFDDDSLTTIWFQTRGYPYFIQYVCRELFDIWVQAFNSNQPLPLVPVSEITMKLDTDFFAGRWAKATDRQRQLMWVISHLENCEDEFTVQEVVESAGNKGLAKPFTSSHINQMLLSLADAGLVYKNRHGKYSFAVPLLADFIQRQAALKNGFPLFNDPE
jgi:hypothetical protein